MLREDEKKSWAGRPRLRGGTGAFFAGKCGLECEIVPRGTIFS